MIDRATGVSMAPPTACSPRPAMSQTVVGASAHRAEAAANRTSPVMKTRLRPNRSAMEPVASRREAIMRV